MQRRLSWTQLPEALRNEIGELVGGPIVAVEAVDGGFSPGFAGGIVTDGGRRAFVKAMARSTQPGWVFLYEREAEIAPHLPSGAPFPHLIGTTDDGDWVVLAFEWIEGRPPSDPWTTDEVERVLAAVGAMNQALTPAPAAVPDAGAMWAPWFDHWGDIVADPARADALGVDWARRFDELLSLEARWPEAVAGDALVHLDLRGDNLLLTDDDVFVVDWAFGAHAAGWVDLVCLLPSVAIHGGPDPEALWRAHPWHASVEPDAFDAFLAAWAGMLTYFSGAGDGALAPELRTLHGEQARAARAWLARRRGWVDRRS